MQQPEPWSPDTASRTLQEAQRQPSIDRNFWLSCTSLMCGFALWMYWSVITVLMLQAGFPHSPTELFSLIAIAGLAGGSLRIAVGFLLPAGGSRYFLPLTMLLLIFPALASGLWLQPQTPLWILQLLALTTGLGGGCCSAFAGAVSARVPRNQQDEALIFGFGLGHLGVVAAQILLPLIATYSWWAGLGGEPLVMQLAGSTWLGGVTAGESLSLAATGYFWLAFLLPLVLLWVGSGVLAIYRRICVSSSTTTTSGTPISRTTMIKPAGIELIAALARILLALFVGLLTAGIGVWLILPADAYGAGLELSRELVSGLVVFTTLMLLRLLPGRLGRSLDQPYAIFNSKHTWLMSVLCAMTLGSFLGFSAALPLTLQLVFGYSHHAGDLHLPNLNAPGIFTYVWMGPLIAVLMHPVGGWTAARFGGARVTQACALVMGLSSAGTGFYLARAYATTEPEQYFLPFFLILLLLFAAAGAGHAAVLSSLKRLFPAGQLMMVNLWISAVAAYGVFYIPSLLGEHLERGTPAQAMIGFALFYAVCLVLNGWFYLRRDSGVFNP